MKGRIRSRGKNSWELTIDVGRDERGKRQRRFVSVKGKKSDAQRRLRALLTAMDQGLPVDNSKITVREYLERWLASQAGLAPQTLNGYRGYANRYFIPHLGNTPVSRLLPIHVQDMEEDMTSRGLSGTTVNQAHRILHKALKDAVKWGVALRNVTEAVTPPRKSTREMQVLPPADLKTLLHAAEEAGMGSLLLLAAHTGLRRGELLGLKWQDVELSQGMLSVQRALRVVSGQGYIVAEPKSAAGRRRISLGPVAVTALRQHRATQAELRLGLGSLWQSGDWVFTRPDGRHLDPDVISHRFKKLVQELDIPRVRLHDLRHTHATLLLLAGVHPKVVQERLGHSSIAITLDTYSHVLPGLQEKAALAFESTLEDIQEVNL
jgi:integrase